MQHNHANAFSFNREALFLLVVKVLAKTPIIHATLTSQQTGINAGRRVEWHYPAYMCWCMAALQALPRQGLVARVWKSSDCIATCEHAWFLMPFVLPPPSPHQKSLHELIYLWWDSRGRQPSDTHTHLHAYSQLPSTLGHHWARDELNLATFEPSSSCRQGDCV